MSTVHWGVKRTESVPSHFAGRLTVSSHDKCESGCLRRVSCWARCTVEPPGGGML